MQKRLTLPKPSCCLCPYPNSRANYSGTLSPKLRGYFPKLRERFPQLRERFPQLREHFPQVRERSPQLTGNKPQVLNGANFYTITSLHRRGSWLKDSHANSINFIKYYV